MQREREKKERGKKIKVATHFLFPSLGPAHEKTKREIQSKGPPPTREINKQSHDPENISYTQ